MKIPDNLVTIPLNFKGKKHFTPQEYAQIKILMKEKGIRFETAYAELYPEDKAVTG